MENKEKFKKPFAELKLFILCAFITIAIYFISDFTLEKSRAMPDNAFWGTTLMLTILFLLGLLFQSAIAFNSLSQSIIYYNKNNKYTLTVLLSLLSIFILSLYWIVDAEFIIGALLFEIVNLFHIGTAIGCFVIFYITIHMKEYNYKDVNSYIIGLNILVTIMFIRSIYFSMGMDDGCRTVGSDPLFGGGGELVCDNDYIKQKDTIQLNSEGKKFNLDAVFMAGFIVRSILAYSIFWLAIFYLHFKDFRRQ